MQSMESKFLLQLLDFVYILIDTYKIFLKNGKLMVFLTLLILSFQSILHLSHAFSLKPLLDDLVNKSSFLFLTTNPGTPEFFNLVYRIYQEARILLGVELIFILCSSAASFFLTIAIVYAAAMTHGDKQISVKSLTLTTLKSWKKPLTSYFYITLLFSGYFFLCFITLIPLQLILGITSTIPRLLTGIPFLFFYLYISVIWDLSFMVSVLEEKSGIEALGKAARIVEGMRVQGFVLDLVATVLILILSMSWKLMSKEKAEVQIVVGILVINSVSMVVRIVYHMAYTVMYYRCKESYGEEVELQLPEVEYAKIGSSLLVNENNIP